MHPEAPAASHGQAVTRCPNCQAPLEDRFCGHCGQRALRLDVSLRELWREGLHEFVHIDGRILGTLRLLLTKPGQLTAEVLAGRRQRYIAPIRLYLVCSVIFFLALSKLATPTPVAHEQVVTDADLQLSSGDSGFQAAIKRGAIEVAEHPEVFSARLFSTLPKTAFVLVPAFALLTMASFRRRVRFFVPHLYFALHVHSFLFLGMTALLALGRWLPGAAAAGSLLMPAAYLVMATRTTFGVDRGEAVGKSLLILVAYLFVLSLAVAAVTLVFLTHTPAHA